MLLILYFRHKFIPKFDPIWAFFFLTGVHQKLPVIVLNLLCSFNQGINIRLEIKLSKTFFFIHRFWFVALDVKGGNIYWSKAWLASVEVVTLVKWHPLWNRTRCTTLNKDLGRPGQIFVKEIELSDDLRFFRWCNFFTFCHVLKVRVNSKLVDDNVSMETSDD